MEHVMALHTLLDTGHDRPTVLRRHPVTTFFALTVGVTWALWLPAVLLQDRMPPAPGFLLRLLGSLVPSTVALVLVAILHGRAGARRLLRRRLLWRVGIGWYLAILALTAVALVAVRVSTLLGGPSPVVVA